VNDVSDSNIISIELRRLVTGRTAAYLNGRQIVKPCWHPQIEVFKGAEGRERL
jgi:hypothetical protein